LINVQTNADLESVFYNIYEMKVIMAFRKKGFAIQYDANELNDAIANVKDAMRIANRNVSRLTSLPWWNALHKSNLQEEPWFKIQILYCGLSDACTKFLKTIEDFKKIEGDKINSDAKDLPILNLAPPLVQEAVQNQQSQNAREILLIDEIENGVGACIKLMSAFRNLVETKYPFVPIVDEGLALDKLPDLNKTAKNVDYYTNIIIKANAENKQLNDKEILNANNFLKILYKEVDIFYDIMEYVMGKVEKKDEDIMYKQQYNIVKAKIINFCNAVGKIKGIIVPEMKFYDIANALPKDKMFVKTPTYKNNRTRN
jgi:hypothetical protein